MAVEAEIFILFEVGTDTAQECARSVEAASGLEIGESEGEHGAMQGERGQLAL